MLPVPATKNSLLLLAAALILPRFGVCQPAQPETLVNTQDAKVSPEKGYRLQPADEVAIHSLQAKEIADKTFRLDEQGNINLPLLGSVHLGGLTIPASQEVLTAKLKKYYVDPDVQVDAAALHTENYSVIGSVNMPGIHVMKTPITLMEAISSAGGLRQDYGPAAVVTREAQYGPIPYPNAVTSSNGQSVATVSLTPLLQGQDMGNNFLVKPRDVISIAPAQVIYVVGNVRHPGGFSLNGKVDLSVMQVLALAEGPDPRAAPERARVLRRNSSSERQIPVDLKRILAGKAEDLVLQPNDILFVPSSTAKVITNRTIDAAVQIGTGLAIFR